MFKKLLILSGMLVVVGWAFGSNAGRELVSYVKTGWKEVRQATSKIVPLDFEIKRAEDLLQNLDYERSAGNGLLAERLAGLDEAEAALAGQRVSEERLMALLRCSNDLRLVYGVRLNVTEETGRGDFDDPEDLATYDIYLWLGWLVEHIVGALGEV